VAAHGRGQDATPGHRSWIVVGTLPGINDSLGRHIFFEEGAILRPRPAEDLENYIILFEKKIFCETMPLVSNLFVHMLTVNVSL